MKSVGLNEFDLMPRTVLTVQHILHIHMVLTHLPDTLDLLTPA